jgi:hypothetical protein
MEHSLVLENVSCLLEDEAAASDDEYFPTNKPGLLG